MSQQSLNVQQVVQLVRRHKILAAALTVAGLLAGAAYSVVYPPLVTSAALVVLPQNAPNIATEVVIADSQPILSSALPMIQPPMSLLTLEKQLSVLSPATGIISISAQGKSAAQAEGAANAVAKSYIAYVRNPDSPVGHVAAQLLQPATTTTGTGAPAQDAIDGGIGALVGLVAGVVTATVVGRRTRKLIALDDIANSIGVPVVTAVPVGHPRDAAGWERLLDGYQAGSVEAWWLRQALLEIGVAEPTENNRRTSSVTVLSLAADRKALALGPQLAAFAASLGIPTALAISPQQDAAAAALYTACAAPKASSQRSRYLRTITVDSGRAVIPRDAQLVVVVMVAEGETPQIPESIPTAVTVLGVSSGAATPGQLARLAMAASTHGREIAGLFVADPDPADRTNGRFPRRGVRAPGRPAPAPAPAPGPGPGPVPGPGPGPRPGPVHGAGPAPQKDVPSGNPARSGVPTERK
jgi:capsular polysaccharide biosynthesis protein